MLCCGRVESVATNALVVSLRTIATGITCFCLVHLRKYICLQILSSAIIFANSYVKHALYMQAKTLVALLCACHSFLYMLVNAHDSCHKGLSLCPGDVTPQDTERDGGYSQIAILTGEQPRSNFFYTLHSVYCVLFNCSS
jgi:hypothetical protein